MSVELDARPPGAPAQSSPTFRQTGFSVPATSTSSTQDITATATSGPSSTPTPTSPLSKFSNTGFNASLQVRSSQTPSLPTASTTRSHANDGDTEMAEANQTSSQLPLPIPMSSVNKQSHLSSMNASHSPNDIPTPPDAMVLAAHKPCQSPGLAPTNVRLPPLHSSILGPRFSTLQASSVPNGPSPSTLWSSGKSSDPHLYSISASKKYSYTSFKPSLSTSFKTSAERGRSIAFDDDDDQDEDDDGDAFGKPSSSLGLVAGRRRAHPHPHNESGADGEGDAAGVFSFSSPYFGPKQLPDDTMPSPDVGDSLSAPQATSSASSNVLSPSWATASLGKLTLGSPEARSSTTGVRRPSRPHNMYSLGQMAQQPSSSLPSSADAAVHAAMKHRRYSYNKHARPSFSSGPNNFGYSASFGRESGFARHPYARTPVSSSWTGMNRSASRSRSRTCHGADDRLSTSSAADGDETDEEMRIDDDDDATEDEADYAYTRYPVAYRSPSGYATQTRRGVSTNGERSRSSTPSSNDANPSSASLGLTFQMSPSTSSTLGKGHPLESSRSLSLAQSGDRCGPVSLSRQYSSDRHPPGATLAPHRHHPYSTSPGGGTTGPLGPSIGLAYPSGSNVPLNRPVQHRRGSSLGNSLNPGFGVAGAMLSTSPRFANGAAAYPARDRVSASYGQEDHESANYLGQSPYGSGSSYPASQRGNGSNSYYLSTSASSSGFSQSPRYGPASFGTRNESGSFAQSLPSHFEPQQHPRGYASHERSDSMTSEATEVGEASRNARAAAVSVVRSNSNMGASGNVDETAQVAAIRDRLGGAASCSAFISKLWHLMINPDLYSKYIRWDEAGSSIILSSEPDTANEFASEVLPRLFKHGNNASFVRQLNLYGFQRIPSSRLLDPIEMKVAAARRVEMGANASTTTLNTAVQLYGAHSSFAHPRFRRGHEELLPTMKPRSSKKPKKAVTATTAANHAGPALAPFAVGIRPPKTLTNDADTNMGGDETDEEEFALT